MKSLTFLCFFGTVYDVIRRHRGNAFVRMMVNFDGHTNLYYGKDVVSNSNKGIYDFLRNSSLNEIRLALPTNNAFHEGVHQKTDRWRIHRACY